MITSAASFQKSKITYADVGISYSDVIDGGQMWRLASAPLSHISLIHLLFNMSALWNMAFVESLPAALDSCLGPSARIPMTKDSVTQLQMPAGNNSIAYLRISLLLLILSGLISLLMYHVLIHNFRYFIHCRCIFKAPVSSCYPVGHACER